MVLQQAPQRAKVWGFAAAGEAVTVLLDGMVVASSAPTDNEGRWSAYLPATYGALNHEHQVVARTAKGEIGLEGVLFGEVWICSGQSNMVRPVGWANASAVEIKTAASYTQIRLFQVARVNGSATPRGDFFPDPSQRWASTSDETAIAAFSATCWFYGRGVYDGWSAARKVPLGLVQSAWGGTRDELWSSPAALAECPNKDPGLKPGPGLYSQPSALWNSMVYPMLQLTQTGAVWYQGEANAGGPLYYNCSFPAMIDDWRAQFHRANNETHPVFPFGFVQLNSVGPPDWKPDTAGAAAPLNESGFPGLRWAQSASYGFAPNPRQTRVFMAVVLDTPTADPDGDGMGNYSVHSRFKQPTGARLALGALSTVYGIGQPHTGPVPRSARNDAGIVTIAFAGLAPDDALEVRHTFGFEVFDPAAGAWANASIATAEGGRNSVTLAGSWKGASHVRYLWESDPCPLLECPLYSQGTAYKLPASPFWAPLEQPHRG